MKRPAAPVSLRQRARTNRREIALALVLTLFAVGLLWAGLPGFGR